MQDLRAEMRGTRKSESNVPIVSSGRGERGDEFDEFRRGRKGEDTDDAKRIRYRRTTAPPTTKASEDSEEY